jgi:serine/threonine protein kinase
MHRDLKLPNIMLHFDALRPNICLDQSFKLSEFTKDYDFRNEHQKMTCKLADLGFARKL